MHKDCPIRWGKDEGGEHGVPLLESESAIYESFQSPFTGYQVLLDITDLGGAVLISCLSALLVKGFCCCVQQSQILTET